MNNKEMLSLLLKIKQETKSIEHDDPYQVWVFESSSYVAIENDIARLKEVDDLKLESIEKDGIVNISLLLTSDIN